MKKKDFITLVSGVIGGLLFSIGLCMCLLPEWNAFAHGVVITGIGACILLTLLGIWLKHKVKTGKKPDWKLIGKIAFAILGCLVLGLGMCMIMVWQLMLWGILVGVVGIVLLLCLIPMFMGLK